MSEENPAQPAETIELTGAQAPGGAAPSGKGGKKGLIIAGSVVGAVAVIAGGTVAAVSLTGGAADSAADVLPASTFAYAEVDLTQAGQAVPTLMKLPSLKQGIDLNKSSDLREKVVSKACSNVDFAKDVAPWLGNKAAIGAVPGAKEPIPAIAVEVTDADAADKGLGALKKCAGEDAVWSISDGWALVTETSKELTAVQKAVEKGTLADDAGFKKWNGEVGTRGFVTAYASDKALGNLADAIESGAFDSAESKLEDNPLGVAPQASDPKKIADQLRKASGEFKGGAVTVRAVKDAFEVEGAAQGTGPRLGETGTLAGSLPDDTTLAIASNPVTGWLDKVKTSTGSDLDKQFSALAGISIGDVETLLGDSFSFSVGKIDLANPADIAAGLKIQGDSAGVKTVVDKITSKLGASGVVTTDTSGDLAAVGMSPDYRKALLADGGLGKSTKFTAVVPDADKAISVFYVDFDGLDDTIGQFAPQVADDFEALGQIGLSMTQDGDTLRTFGKLTFDK